MTAIDLADKSPDELEALAARYRQAARDAEELRILKLQNDRDNVVDIAEHIPNKPALGAYNTTRTTIDPVAIMRARHHDDPARLAEIVREVALFTNDRRRIAETAVSWAQSCNIAEDEFVPVIIAAMNDLPRGGRRDVS